MTTSLLGILQTSSTVRITHKADYAVRAMTALAAAERDRAGVPVKRELLAERESIPPAFLDDILRSLRNGGLTLSQRGAEGGWRLARPAEEITVAEVIRAVEGPLAAVRGIRPHELPADGVAEPFVRLWVATRVALRSVLDTVTLADLASGRLPKSVEKLLDDPDAWSAR
jgi:Rrf2 family protein